MIHADVIRNIRSNCEVTLLLVPVLFVILAAMSCQAEGDKSQKGISKELLQSSSGYVAVLLSTGQVHFGKIEGLDTPYPVLHDVFYVQTAQKKETGEPSYVLIRRGKEAHGPDRMVLNASHIILIEPVSRDSKVAKLIIQAKQDSE